MQFKKAKRVATILRSIFVGASGSGKTRTALKVMRDLVGPDGKILVIDTEISAPGHGASEMYEEYNHHVLLANDMITNPSLGLWTPDDMITAMQKAVNEGFDAIIVDSLTDEWVNYLLWKERISDRYSNTVKPAHIRLMTFIENCPVHFIGTLRAREKAVWSETDNGKPGRILRMAEQADGPIDVKYRSMLTLDFNDATSAIVSKSRYSEIQEGTSYDIRLDDNGEWESDNLSEIILTSLDIGAKTKQRFMIELKKLGYYTIDHLRELSQIEGFGQYSTERHDEMIEIVKNYQSVEV